MNIIIGGVPKSEDLNCQTLDKRLSTVCNQYFRCMLDHPPSTGSHQITFLPLASVSEMGKKAKFKNLFNIMYFSNRYVYM